MTKQGCENVSTSWSRNLAEVVATYTGFPRMGSMGRQKEGMDQDVHRALLSNAMVGLHKNAWTASRGAELSEGGVACQ
jgi:hypothetical protein